MSYQISVTEKAISLSIGLEQCSFVHEGTTIQMLKLPQPLAFSRKASCLKEVQGGELATVYVFKRVDMDPMGYDHFANNLCRDTPWLLGQSYPLPIHQARACVMVVSNNRPLLFIDTEGSSYARYVSRLG